MKFFKHIKKTDPKYFYALLVVLFFIAIRVPSLGHDSFNTDVWKWKARTYDFGAGVFGFDFEKTVQKYHPGVTLMWVGTFAVKVFNAYYEIFLGIQPPDNLISTVFMLHTIQKLFLVFTIGLVLGVFYLGLQNLISTKQALFVTLLLTLEPFYIALTRVFHLEGLMTTLMLASLIWFVNYLNTKNRRHLILFSTLASLAFLTKTSSLILGPFYIIMLLIYGKRRIKDTLVVVIQMILIMGIVFLVCWPATWTHLPLVVSTLFRGIFTIGVERGHEHLILGETVADPGFSFYILTFLFRTSVLLLLGLGLFFARFKKFHKSQSRLIVVMLSFALVYWLFMTIPSKKLDRYLLPSILSLGILSYYALYYVFAKYKYFLVLLILVPVITIWRLHPDYFAYYSPLFGGLRYGIHYIEPKWLIGEQEILADLQKIKVNQKYEDFPEGESLDSYVNSSNLDRFMIVGFQEKYFTQIYPFVEEKGMVPVIEDITALAKYADYFVYPSWDDRGPLEDRFDLVEKQKVYKGSVHLYTIYEKAN